MTSDSLTLRVKWSDLAARMFSAVGINIPWDEREELSIQSPGLPLTIAAIGAWIQTRVERLYFERTRGQDWCKAQVIGIRRASSPDDLLPWKDKASRHLSNGDALIVDCQAITAASVESVRSSQPEFTEEDLERARSSLRFGLNDRVLCNCGPRWLSGHVVGTAVPDEDVLFPYLVKTDPLPGVPSKTISVPRDEDDVCTQEVCFDPSYQMHLAMAAAAPVKVSPRPKLRFGAGDAVFVRVRNSAEDRLECWVAGTVGATWPELPGERGWQLGDVRGEFPDALPYRVDLGRGGWLYCHRDHHTLIRREGFQPQTRVKGTSSRMEVRRIGGGGRETVDHQTERRKRLRDEDLEEED